MSIDEPHLSSRVRRVFVLTAYDSIALGYHQLDPMRYVSISLRYVEPEYRYYIALNSTIMRCIRARCLKIKSKHIQHALHMF